MKSLKQAISSLTDQVTSAQGNAGGLEGLVTELIGRDVYTSHHGSGGGGTAGGSSGFAHCHGGGTAGPTHEDGLLDELETATSNLINANVRMETEIKRLIELLTK